MRNEFELAHLGINTPDPQAALELGKRIGVTLTDSLLMAPSKSVTAVMGLSRKPRMCSIQGCEACGKKDCAYRR